MVFACQKRYISPNQVTKVVIVLFQGRFPSMKMIAEPCWFRRLLTVFTFQMSQPGCKKRHFAQTIGELPNNKMKTCAFEISLIALIKLIFPREWFFKCNFNSASVNSKLFFSFCWAFTMSSYLVSLPGLATQACCWELFK